MQKLFSGMSTFRSKENTNTNKATNTQGKNNNRAPDLNNTKRVETTLKAGSRKNTNIFKKPAIKFPSFNNLFSSHNTHKNNGKIRSSDVDNITINSVKHTQHIGIDNVSTMTRAIESTDNLSPPLVQGENTSRPISNKTDEKRDYSKGNFDHLTSRDLDVNGLNLKDTVHDSLSNKSNQRTSTETESTSSLLIKEKDVSQTHSNQTDNPTLREAGEFDSVSIPGVDTDRSNNTTL